MRVPLQGSSVDGITKMIHGLVSAAREAQEDSKIQALYAKSPASVSSGVNSNSKGAAVRTYTPKRSSDPNAI